MPWKARTAMEERKQFNEERQLQQDGFAELCRRYRISRQTGYQWVERFERQGELGLAERSRAPHQSRRP